MKSIDLYTAVHAVDDDILERSETYVLHQKTVKIQLSNC